MQRTKLLLLVGVFIATYLLMANGLSSAITALLVLASFTSVYMFIAQYSRKKRLDYLNKALDPELFIQGTEKQMSGTGKRDSKTKSLLAIDLAVGYMAMGDNEKALEYLDQVNQAKLADKNHSKLMYNINRIMCLARLGRVSEAEELFDAELEEVSASNGYVKQGVDRVLCEMYFFLERYEYFKEVSTALIEDKPPLSLRTELDLKFRVAQVAEIEGESEKAIDLYQDIAERGNKLWVAAEAAKRFETLEKEELGEEDDAARTD